MYALQFARRKRICGSVGRQIIKPEIHKSFGHRQKFARYAFRHEAHIRRNFLRNGFHPRNQLAERHCRHLGKSFTVDESRSRYFIKSRAAAIGARRFDKELRHAFHAGFVFYLRKSVFNGINGIIISEIEFARLIGIFRMIKYVLFLRRTVIDDFLFSIRKITERNVRPDSHFPANVGHQRPHKRIPRSDRALVYRKRIVRNKRFRIYFADNARPRTCRTRSGRIEREIFRGGRVEYRSAHGADRLFARGDVYRRRNHMPVRTDMTAQTREHKP